MHMQVVGLDFAQEMLDDASRRDAELPAYWDRAPIDWVQGDALQLPFDDNSFDAATMGFGLRCTPSRASGSAARFACGCSPFLGGTCTSVSYTIGVAKACVLLQKCDRHSPGAEGTAAGSAPRRQGSHPGLQQQRCPRYRQLPGSSSMCVCQRDSVISSLLCLAADQHCSDAAMLELWLGQ